MTQKDPPKNVQPFAIAFVARLIHWLAVLALAWVGIKWLSGLAYSEQAKGLQRLFFVLGIVAVVPEFWIRRIAARSKEIAAQSSAPPPRTSPQQDPTVLKRGE